MLCLKNYSECFSFENFATLYIEKVLWTSRELITLQSDNIKIMPHSPWSPDLTPCDFWLFTTLKEKYVAENWILILTVFQQCRVFLGSFQKRLLYLLWIVDERWNHCIWSNKRLLDKKSFFFHCNFMIFHDFSIFIKYYLYLKLFENFST